MHNTAWVMSIVVGLAAALLPPLPLPPREKLGAGGFQGQQQQQQQQQQEAAIQAAIQPASQPCQPASVFSTSRDVILCDKGGSQYRNRMGEREGASLALPPLVQSAS
jgi:hypothetical protein